MPSLTRRAALGVAFGLIVALYVLAPSPAGAIGRRLDLATMAESAGTIVSGRITQLRPGSHPKYPNIGVLYVTMKVNETLKGTPRQQFTFMQFTGRAMNSSKKTLAVAYTLSDLPSYRVGEEVVLFLYPASSVGFTSPVGGPQGKFQIRRDPGEPATVISEGGNRSLTVNRSLPGGLTKDQQTLLRSPGEEIDLKTFRATVKGLSQQVK
jgi:hypothetical protein